jgi:C4-dicarboxylate-specific signal transduction histidine kinase
MHQLLRRQLQRAALALEGHEDPWRGLLEAVGAAYGQADEDRALLERSLELTSQELLERNQALRRDVEVHKSDLARLRAILSGLPDPVLLLSAQGALVGAAGSAHPALLPSVALSGEALERHLGQPLLEALRGEVEALRAGGEPRRVELSWGVGADALWLELRVAAVDAGRYLALLRDQSALRRIQEKLRVQDRMASVGTMAAGVAHEINNPLTYVMINLEQALEILAEPDPPPELLREMLRESLLGVERVRDITRELKTFTREPSATPEALELHPILESSLRLAYHEIRYRARLVRRYDPALPRVLGQRAHLGQIFLNLLSNAIHAIPEGASEDHEVCVATYVAPNGDAVIEISDTGVGLPEELLPRIFEPFVTTKPPELGTGLGLSICQNLVLAMGGELSGHNQQARGALFRVRLPGLSPGG